MSNFKIVIINYDETLQLLYNHVHTPFRETDMGLSDIMFTLIAVYFCNREYYSTAIEDKLIDTLEYHGMSDFESNQIGTLVSNSIMEITSRFLPGFKSYNENHCLDIRNVSFLSRANVHLTLTNEQFNMFVNKQIRFLEYEQPIQR